MYDLAIIGAGPGGYIAAIRAAQLGASVVLIEKDSLGGTCLNRGCIPSKTLLCAADHINSLKKFSKYGIFASYEGVDFLKLMKRKDITILKLQKGIENLLKANKITVIKGEATVVSADQIVVNDEKIKFKNMIIATGSQPCDLPNIKRDGGFIMNSDDILQLKGLPKSLLIVGSGAIGIEWARIFSSLGVDVTITDIADKLSPASDVSISQYIQDEFKKNKIRTVLSANIENIEGNTVKLSTKEELTPDKILIAAGRKPDLGFVSELGLKTQRGYVSVDSNFKTSIDNIYAIGDINGIMQLAHVASHQGVSAVEHILLQKNASIDYTAIPFVIYGKPEIASVGQTESDDAKVSIFPLNILGKSVADDETEGFVKVIAKNNLITGAHIVAKEASSLIHVLALAIKEKIEINALHEFIFAHPTYSEGIQEAILGLDSKALHLLPLEAD
ncbi:MAG: dihydrolipoyl dehydrogenase [Candidatus Gastranaerophilales bacterium]|nr:dihydrolipoyl dehydrogenase [Candidatus Gastranaerophilales bacterium]